MIRNLRLIEKQGQITIKLPRIRDHGHSPCPLNMMNDESESRLEEALEAAYENARTKTTG